MTIPGNVTVAGAERAADALMHALLFGRTDLEANRSGRLTDTQRDMLRSVRNWQESARLGLTGRLLPFVLAIIVVAGLLLNAAPVAFAFTLATAWLVVACVALLVYGVVRKQRDAAASFDSAVVHTIESCVRRFKILVPRTRVESYFIAVDDGTEFRVTAPAWEAFNDGRAYRIYFVRFPSWSWIVSAEDRNA